MAKSAKPAGVVVPQGEAREGVVSSVEKRTTKAGGPMLILTIGEERVSFFESADVDQPAVIGDTVKFALTRKGTYLNGKGLAVTSKSAPQPNLLSNHRCNPRCKPRRNPNRNQNRNPPPRSLPRGPGPHCTIWMCPSSRLSTNKSRRRRKSSPPASGRSATKCGTPASSSRWRNYKVYYERS